MICGGHCCCQELFPIEPKELVEQEDGSVERVQGQNNLVDVRIEVGVSEKILGNLDAGIFSCICRCCCLMFFPIEPEVEK